MLPVWPRVGQELFEVDPGQDHTWVNITGWYDYHQGFLAGAQALLAAAEAGEVADADRIPVAMVFLYRHYLELTMKTFILDNAGLVGRPSALEKTHDLPKLWRSCRAILEAWWPNQHQDELDAIEDQVGQFHLIDPDSSAHRYPQRLNGDRSLGKGHWSFSLRRFAERVEAIGLWLEGMDVGLCEEASVRAEVAEEARREAADYVDDG